MLDYAEIETRRRQPHQLATGGCAGVAVRGCRFRSGVLPVRRDVLSRSPVRLPRGPAGAQSPADISCSTSGIASRRTCSPTTSPTRWRTFFPNDPPRFMARTPHGYHDTALIRSDLAKAGFYDVDDRDQGGAEPRPLCPPCRAGLLPGNPAAQRDRSAGSGPAGGRDRPCGRRHRRQARQRRDFGQDPGPCHPRPGLAFRSGFNASFYPPGACRAAGIGVGCPPEIRY